MPGVPSLGFNIDRCIRGRKFLVAVLHVCSSYTNTNIVCLLNVLKLCNKLTFRCLGVLPSACIVDALVYQLRGTMMQAIYFRKKPLVILVGLSGCLILWMAIQQYKRVPLERRALTITKEQFMLEAKPFRILSGSIHYFRVLPEYWRDRLLKLKAMGLNTVET